MPDLRESFAAATSYRARALRSLAFGVSSTPRGRQKPAPIVADRAQGAYIFDIKDNRFIDYALGYGPLILGHSPLPVIAAVKAELDRGLRTASVHAGEATLAELVAETVPSAELSAFVSTGSEAIQLALRTARAVTGKTRVIKFRGNYHGWFDNVQVANSPGNDGPATLGQDPVAASSMTIVDWGDTAALEQMLTSDFAAVLLEPAAVNGGCIAPPEDFLLRLRAITEKLGVVLIFDEVITGYRYALGGAQAVYGVLPDITVIGKAMGAGFPISAITGTTDVMEPLTSGRLMHRGTFNGNPVSVAAGIACIADLREQAEILYPRINSQAETLRSFIETTSASERLIASATRIGSAVQVFLGTPQLKTLGDTANADLEATSAFAADLLSQGVQIIPRGLLYLSSEHTDEDIETTKTALGEAIRRAAARAAGKARSAG